MRYKAWGETRYTSGTTPTTFGFTGQRQEVELGLYFYNARWYDPALGRFIQADTIVPQPGNSQAWDRYAYTLNNPLRYVDPSGYDVDCSPWDSICRSMVKQEKSDALLAKLIGERQEGIITSWEQLSDEERQEVLEAGWTPGEYDDFGGNAIDVGGTYQDAAVWLVSLIGAGKLSSQSR